MKKLMFIAICLWNSWLKILWNMVLAKRPLEKDKFLKRLQVKVSDMGGILTGSSAGALRGAQALRFFQTHQIRVSFASLFSFAPVFFFSSLYLNIYDNFPEI